MVIVPSVAIKGTNFRNTISIPFSMPHNIPEPSPIANASQAELPAFGTKRNQAGSDSTGAVLSVVVARAFFNSSI